MAIASATLIKDAWTAVYTLINTNVTDPESRSQKWIFAKFPDATFEDSGYPIITIEIPTVDSSMLSFNSIRLAEIGFMTEIYSDKIEQLLDISSSVESTLTNKTNQDSMLDDNNLSNLRITGGDVEHIILNDRKTHMQSFIVLYDFDDSQ